MNSSGGWPAIGSFCALGAMRDGHDDETDALLEVMSVDFREWDRLALQIFIQVQKG
jgi:hypothetical protein